MILVDGSKLFIFILKFFLFLALYFYASSAHMHDACKCSTFIFMSNEKF